MGMRILGVTSDEVSSANAGVNRLVRESKLALASQGVDLDVCTTPDPASWKKYDAIWLMVQGLVGERFKKSRKAMEERGDAFRLIADKIPSAFTLHDVVEIRCWKHSYEYFAKDIVFDVILPTAPSCQSTLAFLKRFYSYRMVIGVNQPFTFTSRTRPVRKGRQASRCVVSTSRIAANKHQDRMIGIAKMLREKTLTVRGGEHMLYFLAGSMRLDFYLVKRLLNFKGPYATTADAFFGNAFLLDLTVYENRYGFRTSSRPQYVTLEAINHGCIPIMYGHWYWGQGSTIIQLPLDGDSGQLAEVIDSAKYDYRIACENLASAKKHFGIDAVGRKLAEVFEEITSKQK